MRKLKLFIATSLLLAANFSFGASFDCQKASMPIEKAICANPVLSSLDEQMAEIYGKAKLNNANSDKLKQEQVSWIKEVRSCSDDACIESQYSARISTLRNQIAQPAAIPTEASASSGESNANLDTKSVEAEAQNPAASSASSEVTSIKKEETSQPRPEPTMLEIGLGYGIGVLILLGCFVVYNKFPKLRFLTIATPFDIGAKFDKTEAYEAVKKSRQWSEFWIFLVTVILYFFIISGTFTGSSSIPEAIFNPFIAFIIPYVIYIIWHGIKGYSSRCPKCKNSYAKSLVNSYKEPRSTYEKRQSSTTQGDHSYRLIVMEVGVNHSDYTCTVCGHDWHVASSYEKQVSNEWIKV
jgi:uncharacterized protein